MSQLLRNRRTNQAANNKSPSSSISDISMDIKAKLDVTTSDFDVKEEIEKNNDLDEYKKEIDRILEEKKIKLVNVFQQERGDIREKYKKKYEEKYQIMSEEEKEKMEKEYKEKKEKLESENKRRLENEKSKIRKAFKDKESQSKEEVARESKKKINDLKEEINQLKEELENLSRVQKVEDDELFNLEIKKYERECENEIQSYQISLDKKYNEKKNELKDLYDKKKNEFEESLIKAQEKEKQNSSVISAQDTIIQSQKAAINRAHEVKLENYKNSLMSEYNKNSEKEKKEIKSNYENEVNLVKNNYEQLKNFYEQQKLIFQSEQSVLSASSFSDKMKNVLDNKNSVFKNLIEQNYFILKKKLKECEDIKELDSFSNKEMIMNKISELLNMIFYSNIYETLYQDLNSEKDSLQKHLDDLIKKCEGIISTFNSEKKIQLGMYLCNPNFN